MQFITHHRHAVNLSRAERWISAIGGGVLIAAALKKRSPAGLVMAVAGGDLLRRGVSGHSYLYEAFGVRSAPKGQGAATTAVPYELGLRVDAAVTVDRPREEVFRFWRNFANFPSFMKHVRSVRLLGGGRSRWVVDAPRGRTVQWDAVIHNEIENERIAWRSLDGGDVDHAGTVLFRDAADGGTEVRMELQYNPPAGAVGAALAMLWGEEPGQQIQEDLQRFKRLLEAEDEVQIASEESFPASDAPAYTMGGGHR